MIEELITDLLAAEIGSRSLDDRITSELHPRMVLEASLHYTTSLDAMLTLVPEGGSCKVEQTPAGNGSASFCGPGDEEGYCKIAASPALAGCIAFFTAFSERSNVAEAGK